MSNHTPGLWFARKARSQNEIWADPFNTRGQVNGSILYEPIAELSASFGERSTIDANAQLIAAAPELLDACRFVKNFLTKLEDDTQPDDPLKEIRRRYHAPLHSVLDAAIAKAEDRPTPDFGLS